MGRREFIITFLLLFSVALVFFYKVVFQGLIPFPGDLLVSEYQPWRTYSYLGYNQGSIPSKVQYFDTLRQIYPWKTFSIDSIKEGSLPLWNPYNFSGSPLLANSQSAIFYPLNIFYFFLPQTVAWTVLIILQPLLAGLFTFLFARNIGIGTKGSLLSAIAFAYSLFMAVFLEYNTIGHVTLWLPLGLYAIEQLRKKVTISSMLLFVGSIVFSFFAGHLQIFAFSFIFLIGYALFRLTKKSWGILSFLCIVALGISAIQLLPTAELINLSARSPQEYTFLIEKLLIQPQQLMLLVSPDFFGNPATRNYLLSDSYPGNALYIGLIPFLFSLLAIVRLRKNFFVSFFALISFALLILFIRSSLTELLYRLPIPLLSTGSPTNAIFLLSFSLSILAGFGIDEWLKKTEHKTFTKIMLITGAVFVFVWVGVVVFHLPISIKNFIYSSVLFGALLFSVFSLRILVRWKQVIVGIIFLLTIADLFYFFHKFNPFVRQELVFPPVSIFDYMKENQGIDRFWGGEVEANIATQYGLFSPEGYDPLYPRRYGEFLYSSTNFSNQTRSDAVIKPDPKRNKLLNVLGVKYVLDRAASGNKEEAFPVDQFSLVYEKDGWRVFENKKALARVFLASQYRTFSDNQEFESIFFADDFDPGKTILLESQIDSFNPSEIPGTVDILSYQPNEIILQTKTDSSKLLFLSDTYFPGWKGFIDGAIVPIYRAHYAFRAVIVPQGEHTMRFTYEPQSFSLGAKTTIISLATFGIFVFWMRKKKQV